MKTVLVVDDEYLIRWSLCEGLKGSFNVLTAGSVDDAEALLRSTPVDAVVTDLRMPGRDGLELVERLRSVSPAVKIFVITAFGSDPVIDRLFALDVEGFIRKPFEVQLIRDMLATHLGEEIKDQRSEIKGRTA